MSIVNRWLMSHVSQKPCDTETPEYQEVKDQCRNVADVAGARQANTASEEHQRGNTDTTQKEKGNRTSNSFGSRCDICDIATSARNPADSLDSGVATRLRHAATAMILDAQTASRGPCVWCGKPVTRIGPNQGFRNAYLELVHLRCPS
jgi:hypothetical protein